MNDDQRKKRDIGIAGCRVLRDLTVERLRELDAGELLEVTQGKILDMRRRLANLNAVIGAYERDMEGD